MGNLTSWLHSPSLRQPVSSVDVVERELPDDSVRLFGALPMARHAGLVAGTGTGKLYLIEKGVSCSNDEQFKERYRRGECRIVLTTEEELQRDGWSRVKSQKEVSSHLKLQDLFDACGGKYDLMTDNCWHGVERMLERAKPRWYEMLLASLNGKITPYVILLVLIILRLHPVCLAAPLALLAHKYYPAPSNDAQGDSD